jgi:ElaB/YqjD/DUF883 family membrane-anchored ribosome-binding protein
MANTVQPTNSTTDYEAALEEIAQRGAAAIRNTRARVEGVVSDAADKGGEALNGAREVRDTVANTILQSVRERPYTTLALAGFIGFLCGAMRRRR